MKRRGWDFINGDYYVDAISIAWVSQTRYGAKKPKKCRFQSQQADRVRAVRLEGTGKRWASDEKMSRMRDAASPRGAGRVHLPLGQ